MFIKRVEIFGFKSFKNKTVLEFEDQEITGIVGPNGCGKSNVLDALLWVMGENSPRHLRGAALSDVIFSGSQKADPRPLAEVNLILGQSRQSFPGDFKGFSELMISRKAWRDGKSECFINGQACLLKDIREFFMNTGVGCRGFSVIEQESIEKLISAKPPERRFIIEEAAGLSKFKSRKGESERKLKLARQNIKRLDDILSLQESQLSRLTAQAKTAERYRKLKKEIAQLDEAIGALEKQKLFFDFRRLEADQKNLKAQKEKEELALKDSAKKLEEAKARLESLKQKESAFKMEEASLASQIKWLNMIAALDEKKQALEEREAKLCGQLEALGDFKQKELGARLDQKIADFKERGSLQEKTLKEQEVKISACQIERQSIERQIAVFLGEKKSVQTQIQSLMKEKKKAGSLLKKCEQLSLNFDKEAENLAQTEERSAEKLEQSETALSQAKQKVSILEYKICELKKLAQRFESLNEAASHLKKKHPEDFKPLFESLEPAPDCALALDSVLGPYAQSLVPLKDGALERAVAGLKSKNQGKIRFLQSCQIAPPAPSVQKELKESPGFVCFLSEKLKWNVYNSALKPLLSHTALVSDFNTAVQLKKRFPFLCFVTKEGDLLKDSFVYAGSLQGDTGWLYIRSSIESHQREIKAQKIDLKAIALACNSEKEKLIRIRKSRLKAMAQKKDNEQNWAEADQNIKRLRSELLRLTERREGNNKNMESLHEAKENLIQQEKAEKKALAVAQKALSQAQTEWKSLEKERALRQERLLSFDQSERDLAAIRQSIKGLDEEGALLLNMADFKIDPKKLGPGGWRKKSADGSARLDAFKKSAPDLMNKIETEEKQVKKLEDLLFHQKVKPARLKSEIEKKEMEKSWLKQKFLEKYRSSLTDFKPKKIGIEPKKSAKRDSKKLESSLNLTRLEEQRSVCEKKLDKVKGVNFLALEEYEKLFEENAFLSKQRADLDRSQKELARLISHIDKICDSRFAEMLEALNRRFSKVFPVLFQAEGGGDCSARLILHEDPEDGEGGLDIVVRPPGKKAKSVSLLSRGEKALTSLCLIYSLFLVRPAPFCIIDEADGPLDDANIFRFVSVLKEMSRLSQIIIITHNKYSMQSCQKLYGVTMGEPGVSQVVSVDMKTGANQRPAGLAGMISN